MSQETVLLESKHAVQSTSAWGAVTLAIPLVIKTFGAVFGVEFTEAEVKSFEAAAGASQQVYLNVMMIVGAIQLAIGRINARQPIHFVPGKSYFIDAQTGRRIHPLPAQAPIPADVQAAMAKQAQP